MRRLPFLSLAAMFVVASLLTLDPGAASLAANSISGIGPPTKQKGAGPWFRVQREGKWGYIDRAGSLVIPARFADTTPFVDGLAMVYDRDAWCYIDTTGRVVLADVYRPSPRR